MPHVHIFVWDSGVLNAGGAAVYGRLFVVIMCTGSSRWCLVHFEHFIYCCFLWAASMTARRITTEEQAKAALAERRRRAREELERQAERERERYGTPGRISHTNYAKQPYDYGLSCRKLPF